MLFFLFFFLFFCLDRPGPASLNCRRARATATSQSRRHGAPVRRLPAGRRRAPPARAAGGGTGAAMPRQRTPTPMLGGATRPRARHGGGGCRCAAWAEGGGRQGRPSQPAPLVEWAAAAAAVAAATTRHRRRFTATAPRQRRRWQRACRRAAAAAASLRRCPPPPKPPLTPNPTPRLLPGPPSGHLDCLEGCAPPRSLSTTPVPSHDTRRPAAPPPRYPPADPPFPVRLAYGCDSHGRR